MAQAVERGAWGNRTKMGVLPALKSAYATLKLANGKAPRVTPNGQISVIDAIAATGKKNPREVWAQLLKAFPNLVIKCDEGVFPDRSGQKTPVTNREGFLEIMALLPGKAGETVRKELIDTYLR